MRSVASLASTGGSSCPASRAGGRGRGPRPGAGDQSLGGLKALATAALPSARSEVFSVCGCTTTFISHIGAPPTSATRRHVAALVDPADLELATQAPRTFSPLGAPPLVPVGVLGAPVPTVSRPSSSLALASQSRAAFASK